MTESSRTLYTLQNPAVVHHLHPEQARLPFDTDPQLLEGDKFNDEGGKFQRADLPPELATLLDKDLKYLRNKHLSDMVHSGQLSLLYPGSPNHPHQAYVVPNDRVEANLG